MAYIKHIWHEPYLLVCDGVVLVPDELGLVMILVEHVGPQLGEGRLCTVHRYLQSFFCTFNKIVLKRNVIDRYICYWINVTLTWINIMSLWLINTSWWLFTEYGSVYNWWVKESLSISIVVVYNTIGLYRITGLFISGTRPEIRFYSPDRRLKTA